MNSIELLKKYNDGETYDDPYKGKWKRIKATPYLYSFGVTSPNKEDEARHLHIYFEIEYVREYNDYNGNHISEIEYRKLEISRVVKIADDNYIPSTRYQNKTHYLFETCTIDKIGNKRFGFSDGESDKYYISILPQYRDVNFDFLQRRCDELDMTANGYYSCFLAQEKDKANNIINLIK